MKALKVVVVLFLIISVGTLAWLRINQDKVETDANVEVKSVAMWVSNAETVDELSQEANFIVKARVSQPPVSRKLGGQSPMMDESGKNVVGYVTDDTSFSDTVFEVLKVYSGDLKSKNITVLQTDGMMDDPLFEVGEEYVLFLVDISGDPVHAPERELYRSVNPSGRFKVKKEKVSVYGQRLKGSPAPQTLSELEGEIEKAKKNKN